jgi:hypothetical protein
VPFSEGMNMIPFEDLVLEENVSAEELKEALDRRNEERRRVVKGIVDGSINLEFIDDEVDY